MNIFLKVMAAALLMLLAAWVGSEIQVVVAERDYYREKYQQAAFEKALRNNHNF